MRKGESVLKLVKLMMVATVERSNAQLCLENSGKNGRKE
jgi:hypothetical protein